MIDSARLVKSLSKAFLHLIKWKESHFIQIKGHMDNYPNPFISNPDTCSFKNFIANKQIKNKSR